MILTPERIAAAQAVVRELEQLKRDGYGSITSQQQMATLLALVQDKRVSCSAALILIEQWAANYVKRQQQADNEARLKLAKPVLDA